MGMELDFSSQVTAGLAGMSVVGFASGSIMGRRACMQSYAVYAEYDMYERNKK